MNLSQEDLNFKNKDYDFFDAYYKIKNENDRLELCIRFIVEKMNVQSMSAIVGAGFSLNSNRDFPDWAKLLVDAYVEMHPNEGRRKPKETMEERNCRIAKIIRQIGEPVVAAEYEKYKGKRESLDVYIESRIIQKQNLPQNLNVHKSFLRLNWCDVITTNWDNLLERADDEDNKKYETILSAKDLKFLNKNRIVKIHGSLRTQEDINEQKYEYDDCYDHIYLITEKDFENYPINHEGFSNFMKVKILENSFCLFGFSGNDWNFRYWVKELKRIMKKGGKTSNLNPIFLFDVSDKPYDLDQKQFFKNNYIVPLKLDDVFEFMEGVESPENPKNTSKKFTYVFNWFLQEQQKNEIVKFGREKIADNKILQNLAFSTQSSDLKELMLAYIGLPKFEVSNLYFSGSIARQIQLHSANANSWGEAEYLFIYTWCLNNFFSLIHLFRSEKIEEIIKHFIDEKLYQTQAVVFSELIFGYYFDCGKTKDFEKFESLIEAVDEDIVAYQKCKYYFKQLEYEKLKEIVENWFPEKKNNANPLHILCKITFLLHLEKINTNFNKICDVGKLFDSALINCSEEHQLLLFIFLYYNSYKSEFGINSRFMEIVNGLDKLKSVYPKRYLDLLLKKDAEDNLIEVAPNVQKRHQTTTSYPIDNYLDLKYGIFLNFFEYLNLPMEGIVHSSKFVKLIACVDEYNLHRLFSYAFAYFGNSANEECVQTFIPFFLRRFSKKTKDILFDKYFCLFKYKVENNDNPKTLCFLMNEFAKRVEKVYAKKYYNLFFELFSNDKNATLQHLVENGRVWGISGPFADYLKQIDDEKQYKYMLDWVVDKCISANDDFSLDSYKNIYYALIKNKFVATAFKQNLFENDVIQKVNNNLDKFYYLVFGAFCFLDENLKNQCKEFLKQKMSLMVNPYFLEVCYSDEAKERIVSCIASKDYRFMNSAEWPVVRYIHCLFKIDKLNADDLNRMCSSINVIAEIYSGELANHTEYKNLMKSYYELMNEIYESGNAELRLATNSSVKIFKPIYEENAKEILSFEWISSQNGQEFRNSFYESFSYSRTMKMTDIFVPHIGLVFSKILLDNDVKDASKYEAVIEVFNVYCRDEYWLNLFKEDSSIKFFIVRIMNKFKQDIPLCYDDIFIKEQMLELAENAENMGVTDQVISYWKTEGNVDETNEL